MPNPMAKTRKLAEFLRCLRRRCSACASDKATFLLCSLSKFYEKATSLLRSLISKFYARHDITERALRFVAGQAWPTRLGSLLVHVVYFVAVSWFGYVLLADLEARGVKPRGIDLFFTAVSASTGSSMSTVEMDVFSNAQLLVLTVLMFVGGEVFISLVGLASRWSKLRKPATNKPQGVESHDEVELEMPLVADIEYRSTSIADEMGSLTDAKRLRHNAVRSLFFIVIAILLAVHVLGVVAVAAYV